MLGSFDDFPALDHAAMAVARVFAQANIGDDEQVELRFANGVDRALDGGVGIGGLGAGFVLVLGQAEENHGRDAEIGHFPALLDNLIRRLLIDARHRADFSADLAARAREHRIDEALGREARLADEAA